MFLVIVRTIFPGSVEFQIQFADAISQATTQFVFEMFPRC